MANVTIYSTPTCGFCHQAKEYFKEKNITFTDFDVADDEKKAEEMIQKTGQTAVPVIVIDGEIVIGFDKEKINELLHLN
jgi:glutaredoxin-like YruB-family protein